MKATRENVKYPRGLPSHEVSSHLFHEILANCHLPHPTVAIRVFDETTCYCSFGMMGAWGRLRLGQGDPALCSGCRLFPLWERQREFQILRPP